MQRAVTTVRATIHAPEHSCRSTSLARVTRLIQPACSYRVVVCMQVQASGPLTDTHQSALEVISQVFSTEAAAGSGGSGDLGTSHMDLTPYQGFHQRGRGRGSGGKAHPTPASAPPLPALACLPAVSFVAKTMPEGLCAICLNAAVVQAMWTSCAEMA